MQEPWPIKWIDEETVVNIATKTFRNALKKVSSERKLQSDPTLVVAMATLLDLPSSEVKTLLTHNASIKSFQNAIGNFHQELLGSVEGWESTGSAGGVIDIRSKNPVPAAGNRFVLAEVKMRFNTIKASDEAETWTKLDLAVRSRDKKNYVAYLMQIVPKTPEAYDREWKVSNRLTVSHIRAIDGKTAYHLVTGDPKALDDLIHQLPRVFRQVLRKHQKHDLDLVNSLEPLFIDEVLAESIPPKSALQE